MGPKMDLMALSHWQSHRRGSASIEFGPCPSSSSAPSVFQGALMDTDGRPVTEANANPAPEDVAPDAIPLPGGHRRNAVRRIFREMVKEELASGPLPARTRRELVEFASTAGLDAYEARLTIRAVEFELGMATDLTVDPADLEKVSFLTPTTWFLLRFALAVMTGILLAWFFGRARGSL